MSNAVPLEDSGVTVLQERVLGLLEKAGIPTEIIDQIIDLVADGELKIFEGAA